MLGPFATMSRLTPIQQISLAVLSRTASASMSTTTPTTTTTHDRGDRYGSMEWAQLIIYLQPKQHTTYRSFGLKSMDLIVTGFLSLIHI